MSPMDRTIGEGSSADLAQLVETLSCAFQHDPALSWILPDPAQRWRWNRTGVRPEHQGKGWGSAAILQGLTRARSERLPVYLETAKRSNVALYRKLGFKLIGEWDVPKGGPHFWSMVCEN